MLIKSFTIWAPNEHLRKFMERLLFKNYREMFLWPDLLPAHKRWLEIRPGFTHCKYAYISSRSVAQFKALQNLDVISVLITFENLLPALSPGHDILVSGANSCSACTTAAIFIGNQLKGGPSHPSRLIILPNPRSAKQLIARP